MLSTTQKVFLVIAAIFYTVAGILHFRIPRFYLAIMPPYIPWHVAMVDISGVAEIAGGIGLLIPQLRRAAAWGLVALLIAVFPANLYAATSAATFSWILSLRLPLQAVLIWWVLACTKARPSYHQSPVTAG
jgi:uncharacterized membrane protein